MLPSVFQAEGSARPLSHPHTSGDSYWRHKALWSRLRNARVWWREWAFFLGLREILGTPPLGIVFPVEEEPRPLVALWSSWDITGFLALCLCVVSGEGHFIYNMIRIVSTCGLGL